MHIHCIYMYIQCIYVYKYCTWVPCIVCIYTSDSTKTVESVLMASSVPAASGLAQNNHHLLVQGTAHIHIVLCIRGHQSFQLTDLPPHTHCCLVHSLVQIRIYFFRIKCRVLQHSNNLFELLLSPSGQNMITDINNMYKYVQCT